MTTSRFTVTPLIYLPLIACTSTTEWNSSSAPVAMSLSSQRSYLDPGAGTPGGGRPDSVRSDETGGQRQTDLFGNDVLPQTT